MRRRRSRQSEWNSHRDQLKAQQAPVAQPDPRARRPGARVVPARLQRHQGADRRQARPQSLAIGPRRRRRASGRQIVQAGQRPRRAARRRAGGLGRHARLHGRAHQDRRHRHRHRLHARRLRRPGQPRLDYQSRARAPDTLPGEPGRRFGPNAPKVKGGIDLVGDDYNADPTTAGVPAGPASGPEPARLQRPRHAHRGHGGRLRRPRRTATRTPARTTRPPSPVNTWNVGPGVAPKADLYAVRVFGCAGSTDVVVDAIEWAVDERHGRHQHVARLAVRHARTSPDAVASTNAAKDGVIVVASSGNSGPNAVHDRLARPRAPARSAWRRATRPRRFPGATLTLTKADASSGGTLTAIDANGFTPLPPGPFNLKVIYSAPA